MAQSTIGQRGCDMFASTRGDKCANRWGVFDSCGTDQHLSNRTVELTRRRESNKHCRTNQVEKHAPAARVQRFELLGGDDIKREQTKLWCHRSQERDVRKRRRRIQSFRFAEDRKSV